MKTEQLESLLIDQALGELSEEADALLEAYLLHFPERRAEAQQVRQAVGLTEAAVLSRPLLEGLELEAEPDQKTRRFSDGKFISPAAFFRIAAALALFALAGGAGYFAGQERSGNNRGEETLASAARPAVVSPWARYHFQENGRLALLSPPSPQNP